MTHLSLTNIDNNISIRNLQHIEMNQFVSFDSNSIHYLLNIKIVRLKKHLYSRVFSYKNGKTMQTISSEAEVFGAGVFESLDAAIVSLYRKRNWPENVFEFIRWNLPPIQEDIFDSLTRELDELIEDITACSDGNLRMR